MRGSRPVSDGGTPIGYAGLWTRALALVIDGIVLSAAFFVITRAVKGVWIMGPEDHRWARGLFVTDPLCLAFLAAIFGYFVLLEGLAGATPGKRALGIRVVREDGSRAGLSEALLRNALRIVDGLPAFHILGAILIALSPENARFGDRVAGTRVVRAETAEARRRRG